MAGDDLDGLVSKVIRESSLPPLDPSIKSKLQTFAKHSQRRGRAPDGLSIHTSKKAPARVPRQRRLVCII